MKLWKHLRAHWRNPLYAFCEWYVFGRQSNWQEAPTPVVIAENDLPDRAIKAMWEQGQPTTLVHGRTFRCEHMRASAMKAFTCGVCGPLEAVPELAGPAVTWTYR